MTKSTLATRDFKPDNTATVRIGFMLTNYNDPVSAYSSDASQTILKLAYFYVIHKEWRISTC